MTPPNPPPRTKKTPSRSARPSSNLASNLVVSFLVPRCLRWLVGYWTHFFEMETLGEFRCRFEEDGVFWIGWWDDRVQIVVSTIWNLSKCQEYPIITSLTLKMLGESEFSFWVPNSMQSNAISKLLVSIKTLGPSGRKRLERLERCFFYDLLPHEAHQIHRKNSLRPATVLQRSRPPWPWSDQTSLP